MVSLELYGGIILFIIVVVFISLMVGAIKTRNKPSRMIKNGIDYYFEQKRKESFTKEADDKWFEETFKE